MIVYTGPSHEPRCTLFSVSPKPHTAHSPICTVHPQSVCGTRSNQRKNRLLGSTRIDLHCRKRWSPYVAVVSEGHGGNGIGGEGGGLVGWRRRRRPWRPWRRRPSRWMYGGDEGCRDGDGDGPARLSLGTVAVPPLPRPSRPAGTQGHLCIRKARDVRPNQPQAKLLFQLCKAGYK